MLSKDFLVEPSPLQDSYLSFTPNPSAVSPVTYTPHARPHLSLNPNPLLSEHLDPTSHTKPTPSFTPNPSLLQPDPSHKILAHSQCQLLVATRPNHALPRALLEVGMRSQSIHSSKAFCSYLSMKPHLDPSDPDLSQLV